MPDIIEDIQGSIIQHGLHNDRICLMRLNTDDTHGLITTLNDMALKNGYGKIFGKIPASVWKDFKSADYVKEAVIPGFFSGKTDGFFIAKYFSAKRQRAQGTETLLRLVKNAGKEVANSKTRTNRTIRTVVSCKPSDAEEMSAICRQVFSSYPFPIHQPTYLQRMIKEGVLYFCIRVEGRIAAIAAVEIDWANKNAEMTDFATLPKWRSMGFAGTLLRSMDKKVRNLGIITAYTLSLIHI